MANQIPASQSFDCAACLETITHCDLIPMAEGDCICHECFVQGYKPMFEAARKTETAYPVRWSTNVLDIRNFSAFFSPEFLEAYQAKVAEYAINLPDRLYCAGTSNSETCNRFLGEKSKHNNAQSCSGCGFSSCKDCGKAFLGAVIEHICQESNDDDAFRGLELGVHYQRCPNCHQRAELIDGCNHVVHTCGIHMCFTCGARAGPDNTHWRSGMPCAMYGRGLNAIHAQAPTHITHARHPPNMAILQQLAAQERRPNLLFIPETVAQIRVDALDLGMPGLGNAMGNVHQELLMEVRRAISGNGTRASRLRRDHRFEVNAILAELEENRQALEEAHGIEWAMRLVSALSHATMALTLYTIHQAPVPLNELIARRQFLIRLVESMETRIATVGPLAFARWPQLRVIHDNLRALRNADLELFVTGVAQSQLVEFWE